MVSITIRGRKMTVAAGQVWTEEAVRVHAARLYPAARRATVAPPAVAHSSGRHRRRRADRRLTAWLRSCAGRRGSIGQDLPMAIFLAGSRVGSGMRTSRTPSL